MEEKRYSGLTNEQVQSRIREGKQNRVTITAEKSTREIIYSNIFTYFNLVFGILAILLILVRSWNNMLFVPIVVVNSLIGIVQELRSRRILNKMRLLQVEKARVIREGERLDLPVDQVVEGDVALFQAGDQIYADAKVLDGSIMVDESQLTGEADEIPKGENQKLMSGSFVISGQAVAVLEQVGDASYINQLSLSAKKVKGHEESEMVHAVDSLVRMIGMILIPIGLLLFLQSYLGNQDSLKVSITSMVGAIIGMIPEGLYLLMTLALVLGATRLALQKVLLNSMKGIETLSRIDVLCLDKTGTITEHRMQVSELLPLALDEKEGKEILSHYLQASEDRNDTITAIRQYHSVQPTQVWTVQDRLPFSSKKKFGGLQFQEGIYLLGAPDVLLRDDLHAYQEIWQREIERGARVLILGHYQGEQLTEVLEAPVLPLLALVLENPVRLTAPETFAYFQKQGVTIKVISGDHPVTVAAVAQKAGIPNADQVVDASQLKTYEEVVDAARTYTVFGRVSPEQKQILVESLQADGHKVGMTGDGVNDILAMKKADCSIAMNTGHDATKKVAQVVLLDSDFSHMPSIVDEGRRVVNNIQRSASLFLVKNIFSILLAILAILFHFTYPIQASQMSLISGFTIGIPGFLLALEKNRSRIEGDFMETVIEQALPAALTNLISVLFLVVLGPFLGLSQEDISTISIYLLALIGFTKVYQLSLPFNHVKLGIILLNVTGFCLSVFVFSSIFNLSHLHLTGWILTLVLGLVMEGVLWVMNRLVYTLVTHLHKSRNK
ncbi:HAD-IC family P-type ATPase [Streptococcus sp. DFI.7.26]|uniref:HAD-IC family P-type ATPase n=1 Tax=Streptococcus sp. DFI.7.26 TaxID=2916965 RepID=UPI001EE96E0D|nr:HAD-IC family P-type ATPase [Streptococcus sp. DFI.7.26]MCG5641870.1 HAD-IC family P-type ATPase [Streptococcus sp. DFI.7.26]